MPTKSLSEPTPMPGKTYISSSVATLDLSIRSSIKRTHSSEELMSSTASSSSSSASTTTAGSVSKFFIPTTSTIKKSQAPSKASTPTTDPGGGGSASLSSSDTDEVKVFGCEKHEEDVDIDGDNNSDRLSPVVKEEEASPPQPSSASLADRLNSEHQFHSFFPYFISPYYHAAAAAGGSATPAFDKMVQLGSLSKFMSPPPAHLSGSNLAIDPNTGVPNPMYPLSSPTSFPSLYAQHWRPPMFPFVFPSGYPFSSPVLPQGSTSNSSTSGHSLSMSSHPNTPMMAKRPTQQRPMDSNSQPSAHSKISIPNEEQKPKKPHIKKPLNAFMLFMKEQRAQVVQECTLRESAAINQILGRKWHELDRNVQQKYYDMARDERMRHMQLYPGWSARDNYGARKKRGNKGKKREKSQGENGECLNQKKCRARFGLDQQSNWCKHCKRKKKCLRYTEDESNVVGPNSVGGGPWSEDDDGDHIETSDDDLDHCDMPMMVDPDSGHAHEQDRNHHSPLRAGISMDSDEENKSRLLMHQQTPNSNASGSSSSTNGTVPMSLMTTSSTTRKDSSSSASSPQTGSFLHRYSMAPPPPHFSHAHPYFDPFLQSAPIPLLNGLKRET